MFYPLSLSSEALHILPFLNNSPLPSVVNLPPRAIIKFEKTYKLDLAKLCVNKVFHFSFLRSNYYDLGWSGGGTFNTTHPSSRNKTFFKTYLQLFFSKIKEIRNLWHKI
jgi:hypothetical protein